MNINQKMSETYKIVYRKLFKLFGNSLILKKIKNYSNKINRIIKLHNGKFGWPGRKAINEVNISHSIGRRIPATYKIKKYNNGTYSN